MPKQSILLFLAITWTVIITVLSLITLNNLGGALAIPFKDKMVHFVFYFVFVLLWSSYRKSFHFTIKEGIAILFIAIGFGIVIELLQGMITVARKPDILDVLANSTGAFFGFLIVNKNLTNKRKI